MTFKNDWEKTETQHQIDNNTIKNIVYSAMSQNIKTFQIISGGCANLNIKIQLENQRNFLILRIYLRDKDAAYREQKISELLQNHIPTPKIYLIGDYKEYRFAICEFIEGITLRDLLLEGQKYDMHSIMTECGNILTKIASIQFPRSGFFDQNLNVAKESSADDLITYVQNCLKHEIVQQQLGSDIIFKIKNLLLERKRFLPNNENSNLVHADFDPSNILVKKINNSWKIASILDWEFAFSGSILHDVANMLRYTHKMPKEFETSFISSLNNNGVQLPKNWRITINLLNLLSLIDCLSRSDSKTRPNQCYDIKLLITNIIVSI